MDILYSDNHLVICVKPSGVLSQGDGSNDADMVTLLSEHFNTTIYPVHRLDRNTGGIMVFAKNERAAGKLSELIQNKDCFIKEYLAVAEGKTEEKGEMNDLLYKSTKDNKAYIVKKERKGVKKALSEFWTKETVETEKGSRSLVLVRLYTGRFHQIRVQFASRKMPLAGDGKYGSKDNGCEVALWSHRIAFEHPFTGEKMDFLSKPEAAYPWNLFKDF